MVQGDGGLNHSIFYNEIKSFNGPEEYRETAKAATEDMYYDELLNEIFFYFPIPNNDTQSLNTGRVRVAICMLNFR